MLAAFVGRLSACLHPIHAVLNIASAFLWRADESRSLPTPLNATHLNLDTSYDSSRARASMTSASDERRNLDFWTSSTSERYLYAEKPNLKVGRQQRPPESSRHKSDAGASRTIYSGTVFTPPLKTAEAPIFRPRLLRYRSTSLRQRIHYVIISDSDAISYQSRERSAGATALRVRPFLYRGT